MEELFKEIEGINKYDLEEPKKSLFIGMIINSLIILRKVDNNLINLLEDKINNYKEINNNNKDNIYKELMNIIIDYVYNTNNENSEEEISKNIITNYFTNGYIFHAFNAGLYNEISSNGLLVKDRLIDTDIFKTVGELFKKKNAQIFGLYNTKNNNSIFFAGTLHNIYQYGVGSPSFFRKFIFQSDKEDSYLNRNYDKCLKSVLTTIHKYNFNENEKRIILEFFNKYYQIFSTDEYYIAMYKCSRSVDTTYTKEDIKRVFNEELYKDYRIYNDISPNDLVFVSSNIIDKSIKRER